MKPFLGLSGYFLLGLLLLICAPSLSIARIHAPHLSFHPPRFNPPGPFHPPFTHNCNGVPLPIGVPCPTQPQPSVAMCNGIPVPAGTPCPSVPLPPVVRTHDCHGFPLPTQIGCPKIPNQLSKALSQLPQIQITTYLVNCLAAGATCPTNTTDAVKRYISDEISAALRSELSNGITSWELHTRFCVGALPGTSGPYVAPFPAKDNDDQPLQCDDQDMTLFNGLLCSVGDPRGCDGVRRAQGDDGRWWRSPRLVGHDRTHGGADASLSEEQTWGIFLYLLQTKDKPAFEKWVKWIAEQGRPCWIKVGSSCRVSGLPQWCTDSTQTGACNFLPFECVAFEALAREFERNPAAMLAVSRRIGCDLVMGATYGAAGGAFGALVRLGNGLPILLGTLSDAALHDPQLANKVLEIAKVQKPASLKATDFPLRFLSAGLQPLGKLQDVIQTLHLPTPPAPPCIKDLATFGLPLPSALPLLPNGGCVIPPPRLPAPNASNLNLPPLLGPLMSPGFTTGYPVQTQVLVQSLVPYSSFYAFHKVGVQIYLLQRLGLDSSDLQKAAEHLHTVSPGNPFFIYLAKGPSAEVANPILRLKRCPAVNGPQPVKRSQWAWERSEKDEAWTDSSYWDCIFIAKLLVDHEQLGPPPLIKMREAQKRAVRAPSQVSCNGFIFTVVAPKQSPPIGNHDDYQVVFGPPSTTLQGQDWYFNSTLIAPCSGRYSAQLSVTGAPPSTAPVNVHLVTTFRYGLPTVSLVAKPNVLISAPTVTFHLDRYEATSLVLQSSQSHRSIVGAKLVVAWCKNQDASKPCN
jgi:hypothetical protein